MSTHTTTYRVIYGDTDNMGVAYHANYLRWFEIGRAEMFRAFGLTYKTIEARGIMLPVSEVQCKFVSPVKYDDLITIEASIDSSIKGGIKFNYRILSEDQSQVHARGFTLHACLNGDGRVIRPPKFLMETIKSQSEKEDNRQ
jgi:acyl-CoA thioester hydrolase